MTALASFLEARSRGGEWLLRIDDSDPYRTRPGAADSILASLEALGLRWDGAVVRQSQRTERYHAALEQLGTRGLVFACDCSRRELAQTAAGAPAGIYPGTCRRQSWQGKLPERRALRLKTGDGVIRFLDRLQGLVSQDLAREVGDFILYRRDGAFAYHLATVVDDADQGVTEVMRGQDLLDSTPRQIYLQQLLGLPTPAYAHTPILIDVSGHKLSKSTLSAEAETRYPGRILGYLLNLLQHPLPAGMGAAPAAEILAWAIAHWQAARLWRAGPVTVDPGAFRA
jgi:glutamyl-Q tRNA(Asp) synthetase